MLNSVEIASSRHTHPIRGDVPVKEYQDGYTKIIIYSPLVLMTEEEKKQWFIEEQKKGNPILKEIADAVNACYQD